MDIVRQPVELLSISIIIIMFGWKINGVDRLLYGLSQVICGCRFNLAAIAALTRPFPGGLIH